MITDSMVIFFMAPLIILNNKKCVKILKIEQRTVYSHTVAPKAWMGILARYKRRAECGMYKLYCAE